MQRKAQDENDITKPAMAFDNKRLEDLVLSDIELLVNNGVAEGSSIEYKRALGNDDKGNLIHEFSSLPANRKKEFAADITSFANTDGGYILIGIEEEKGVPVSIPGVAVTDQDRLTDSMQQFLRAAVEPHIAGLNIKYIATSSGGRIIVIHVPRSWSKPHMVVFQEEHRFYVRSLVGKRRVAFRELESLFAQARSTGEKIHSMTRRRLTGILAGETPIQMPEAPLYIFHLIPFKAVDDSYRIDVAKAGNDWSKLDPLDSSISNYRYNLDGLVTYYNQRQSGESSYAQLFRNGTIEAASTNLMRDKTSIHAGLIEYRLCKALESYKRLLRLVEVDGPFYASLILSGVKDIGFRSDQFWGMSEAHFDRDVAILDGCIFDDLSVDSSALLRPLFDGLWNAAGLPKCGLYKPDGSWAGARYTNG